MTDEVKCAHCGTPLSPTRHHYAKFCNVPVCTRSRQKAAAEKKKEREANAVG